MLCEGRVGAPELIFQTLGPAPGVDEIGLSLAAPELQTLCQAELTRQAKLLLGRREFFLDPELGALFVGPHSIVAHTPRLRLRKKITGALRGCVELPP